MSVRQIPANIIRPPCNEQTGYTPTILTGMINDIILLQVLRYVKSVSKAEIFEAGYQAQMSEKAIVNKAQRTNRKRKKQFATYTRSRYGWQDCGFICLR